MKTLFLFAPAAMIVFGGSPAFAEELPRYDVAGHCRSVSDVAGGSAMIYRGCMEMEQEAYDGLKRRWSAIPTRMRSYCDEIGRVAGGSYSILAGCVDMEAEADAAAPGFTY